MAGGVPMTLTIIQAGRVERKQNDQQLHKAANSAKAKELEGQNDSARR
jgi:hypothetical protein